MPISANRLNVQALSVEFVDASIRVILNDGQGNIGAARVVASLTRRVG